MADICRNPPIRFGMESFFASVSTISQKTPISILTHPEDPITGSREFVTKLQAASSGTGLIRSENLYAHASSRS